MRTVVAEPHARDRARAATFGAALALAAALSSACAGDGPGIAPRPSHDGQLVQVTGTTEFTYRATRGATSQLIHRGSWTSSGVMKNGVARADFTLRALDRRQERDVERESGAGSEASDSAALVRLLDRAGAMLAPALAVSGDARMAQFGAGSVVESVLKDAGGREVHVAAISDYPRGPLTDIIVAQTGNPLRHLRFDWERRGDVWHIARARATVLLPAGAVMTAESRVTGGRFASAAHDTGWSLAAVSHRIEEIRFAALAKRALLPAEARAQSGSRDPYGPGGSFYDCSAFRNGLVPANSPCVAYALNNSYSAMQNVLDMLPLALGARLLPLLLTGGSDAIAAALAGAGLTVTATLVSQVITALVSIAVGLYAYHFTECRAYHQDAVDRCKASDPRPGGGDGGSEGAFTDTGTVYEACGLSCDPSRRGIIDDWRNGIRTAT